MIELGKKFLATKAVSLCVHLYSILEAFYFAAEFEELLVQRSKHIDACVFDDFAGLFLLGLDHLLDLAL